MDNAMMKNELFAVQTIFSTLAPLKRQAQNRIINFVKDVLREDCAEAFELKHKEEQSGLMHIYAGGVKRINE